MNLVSAQNSNVFNGAQSRSLTLAPAKEREKELERAGRQNKMSIASLNVYYGKFRALADIGHHIDQTGLHVAQAHQQLTHFVAALDVNGGREVSAGDLARNGIGLNQWPRDAAR